MNLIVILAVCFVNGSLASGLIPLLNKVLGDHSATAFAAYFIGSVTGLFAIYFSARLRSLKYGLALFQAGFALSFVYMAFNLNPLGLHIGRFLEGICGGLLLPLSFGSVCANAPYDKVGQRASFLNIAFSLGFVAGPACVEFGIGTIPLEHILFYLAVPPLLTLPFLLGVPAVPERNEKALDAMKPHSLYEWWQKFYYLIFAKLVYGFMLAFFTSFAEQISPHTPLRYLLMTIIGCFIVGQILAHVLRSILDIRVVDTHLLASISLLAVYMFFTELVLMKLCLFVCCQSVIVFIAYKKIAASPDSTRSFAWYNALTDPGLVLGALLASLGTKGLWGLVIAGLLPSLLFLFKKADPIPLGKRI